MVVSLLWFPQNPDIKFIGHAKVAFEDQIWGTFFRYHEEGTLVALQRLAESGKNERHAFYQFDIQLTPKESQRLRAMLDSGKNRAYPLPFCIQGACHLLNWSTRRAVVPFPFNQLPIASVAYLSINRWIPRSRVKRIQYFGTQDNRLARVLNDGLAFDLKTLAVTAGVGAFTFWVMTR